MEALEESDANSSVKLSNETHYTVLGIEIVIIEKLSTHS